MPICSAHLPGGWARRVVAAVVSGALALLALACDEASDSCFRYSDCASGLTCSEGRCVRPPGADEPAAAQMAVLDASLRDAARASSPVADGATSAVVDAGGAASDADAVAETAPASSDAPDASGEELDASPDA